MTNKEILQADLLDILFENRNKAYGAYALRKNYIHRLQQALGISFGLAGFLLILSSARQERTSNPFVDGREVTVVTNDYPKARTREIEPPRSREQPHRAHVRYTSQIQIVDNNQHTDIPAKDEIDRSIISGKNVTGVAAPGANEKVNNPGEDAHNRREEKPEEKAAAFTRSEAQYPGGKDAFAKFLTKNLITPDELEIGEKKTILVRFLVDVDGAISKVEILQSDGEKYSEEVIRVLKKMPKWIPAMQNGAKVATWFSQPVTFIGAE